MTAQAHAAAGHDGCALPVYSVTPFTMLDFPGKTACIVWFSGCNMRCPYCHNPQIVRGKGRADVAQVHDFLERRAGLLDGVVLSGGEVTLYPGLPAFIGNIRKLGYAVKIDTNGTRPDILLPLLESGQIDYVALDYKAPREKYADLTRNRDFPAFSRTLDYLCGHNTPFEVRTTVHTGLLDESDVNFIIADLRARGYRGVYYIQNYINNGGPVLGPLSGPPRKLDRALIRDKAGFEIVWRNFD